MYPNISTVVSYEHMSEEGGDSRVISFRRDVDTDDFYDLAWYFYKVLEVQGVKIKQVSLVMESGETYSTEL